MEQNPVDLLTLFQDDPEMLALFSQGRHHQAHPSQQPDAPPAERSKSAGESALQTLLGEKGTAGPAANPSAAAHTGTKRHKNGIGQILANVLVYGFCIVLLVSSALFALSNDPSKSYFGYRFYNVLTNSMSPQGDGQPGGFRKGDLILVQLVDPNTIQVGDIVTYMTNKDASSYLTHRVVEVKSELNGEDGLYFVTRGDTNNVDDPPISSAMVVGKKVLTIPKVGYIIAFIREHFVLAIIACVAAFALIVTLRYYKRATKAQATAADTA